MEADEETGVQKGMKLSMFDISEPGDVRKISSDSRPREAIAENIGGVIWYFPMKMMSL